tara:strand:+ start:200 stop:418 length:219 start_codon:yes stop_codon:yes gene_type:complete
MPTDIFKRLFEEKRTADENLDIIRRRRAEGIECADCGEDIDPSDAQHDNWTGETVCTDCGRKRAFSGLRGLQ